EDPVAQDLGEPVRHNHLGEPQTTSNPTERLKLTLDPALHIVERVKTDDVYDLHSGALTARIVVDANMINQDEITTNTTFLSTGKSVNVVVVPVATSPAATVRTLVAYGAGTFNFDGATFSANATNKVSATKWIDGGGTTFTLNNFLPGLGTGTLEIAHGIA